MGRNKRGAIFSLIEEYALSIFCNVKDSHVKIPLPPGYIYVDFNSFGHITTNYKLGTGKKFPSLYE